MIVILKKNVSQSMIDQLCGELRSRGLEIHDSNGTDAHILGLVGDTKAIAESWILAHPAVETCRRISEPYKKANRKFHPDDTVVQVGDVKIGGGNFAVMAGPCSIESPQHRKAVQKGIGRFGRLL